MGLYEVVELTVEELVYKSNTTGTPMIIVFQCWVIANKPTDPIYYFVKQELGL